MVDDLYDDLTLRRIDRAGRVSSPPPRVPGPSVGAGRRAVGGGALMAAVALGLQEALDPQEREAVVEEVRPAEDDDGPPAVTLYLVPHAPRLSRAVVRPWLL